jgi:hypothetical protein
LPAPGPCPDLTLPQVHAALLYYYENRDEIEAELADEEQAAAGLAPPKSPVSLKWVTRSLVRTPRGHGGCRARG